jgi:hypothetical protein
VPDEVTRRPLSAIPPPVARVLAFVTVLIGGLAGGLIGYGFVDLQCTGDCTTASAVGAVIGAILAAAGVAVVAVLALRAMGEWRQLQDRPEP